MRTLPWMAICLYVFAIPWEYSLDFGDPWGNIARLFCLLAMLFAVVEVAIRGSLRSPGSMQFGVLAFYLWITLSCLWSMDTSLSLVKVRAYLQVMMIVYLLWEFADKPADLMNVLRAFVGGSFLLALLSLWNLPLDVGAEAQVRFTAAGQDPNDVARYLVLAFPFAVLLYLQDQVKIIRILSIVYLPVGLCAVALSGSRSGALAAGVAVLGCFLLLMQDRLRRFSVVLAVGVTALLAIVLLVPQRTLARLETIVQQLQGGDLNQRFGIWHLGWRAFELSPILGRGAGTFVVASGQAWIDSAHNTLLSIAVTTGIVGVVLALMIFAIACLLIVRMSGVWRWVFALALLIWTVTSLTATVEENRSTWLLLGLIAATERICFSSSISAQKSGQDQDGQVQKWGPVTS